jgi:hypothetical protein
VWRSRTRDGVRCKHFPSVVTTIMDHKNRVKTVELVYHVAESKDLNMCLISHIIIRHRKNRFFCLLYSKVQ